jgi:hypothetical protein
MLFLLACLRKPVNEFGLFFQGSLAMPRSLAGRIASGVAVVAAVLLALYGTARAQQGAVANDSFSMDGIGSAEQAMTGAQQIAWVEQQLVAARSIRRQVESMLDTARKEKETLKITCLDDKLTQIIVNLKGIEERKGGLQAAVQGGDTTTANQHFTILRIYASRVQGLKAEAESCVGDSDVVLGESETIVEIDEDITMEDPADDSPDLQLWVDQPPQASGFY